MLRFITTCVITLIVFTAFMLTGTSLTGCDFLTINDADTSGLSKLNSVNNLSLEVIARDSAQITFRGDNSERNFTGYVLLDSSGTTRLDSIPMEESFSDSASFNVPITPDSWQRWGVAATGRPDSMSVVQYVTFEARRVTSANIKHFSNDSGAGLNVDNLTSEVGVKVNLEENVLCDGSGADIIIRKTEETSFSLVPLCGAVVFLSRDTALYTQSELYLIYDSLQNSSSKVGRFMGVCASYNGEAVRSGSSCTAGTGQIHKLRMDDVFLVVTNSFDVARLKVTGITSGESVSFSIYKDSPSRGILLY